MTDEPTTETGACNKLALLLTVIIVLQAVGLIVSVGMYVSMKRMQGDIAKMAVQVSSPNVTAPAK